MTRWRALVYDRTTCGSGCSWVGVSAAQLGSQCVRNVSFRSVLNGRIMLLKRCESVTASEQHSTVLKV